MEKRKISRKINEWRDYKRTEKKWLKKNSRKEKVEKTRENKRKEKKRKEKKRKEKKRRNRREVTSTTKLFKLNEYNETHSWKFFRCVAVILPQNKQHRKHPHIYIFHTTSSTKISSVIKINSSRKREE